ncbi:MAG: DUF2293 domain-containing protein [Planctomycetes bacterium]|nr:DUF2293 domain-containing protein [Planctomycetota bacterium]
MTSRGGERRRRAPSSSSPESGASPTRRPPGDLKVFVSSRDDSTCDECHDDLGGGRLLLLAGDRGALCLACADLDHLVFLAPGDAALTRRARAGSRLSAVVLRWSRARKRYERQGLLVEEAALARAEEACLADGEARARRRAREAERRAEVDEVHVEAFARRIRELFPGCPEGRERLIAQHACRRHSGRVGRSAGAKELRGDAVRLAVHAHARHAETRYDELLASGVDRDAARAEIADALAAVLGAWSAGAEGRS